MIGFTHASYARIYVHATGKTISVDGSILNILPEYSWDIPGSAQVTNSTNSYITFGRGLTGYIHAIDFLHQTAGGSLSYIDRKYCDINKQCDVPYSCLGVRYNPAKLFKYCVFGIYFSSNIYQFSLS